MMIRKNVQVEFDVKSDNNLTYSSNLFRHFNYCFAKHHHQLPVFNEFDVLLFHHYEVSGTNYVCSS